MSNNVSYFVGLDLGQAKDYSALCVVEAEGTGQDCVCSIRHLRRWQLGTSYPAICGDVVALLGREPLTTAPLIVDATGVGRPVVDILRPHIPARLLHAATITGGASETKDTQAGVCYWNVPKRVLVSTVQVLLQGKRLKIAPELTEAATLTRELQSFQVKITDAANDTYGAWREGAHDDLVLASALSCWGAQHGALYGSYSVLALGKAKLKIPALGGSLLGERRVTTTRVDGATTSGTWPRRL